MIEAFVSSHSTCTDKCRTVVCFLAGILTYRNNFEAAAYEVAQRYPDAKIVVIFPYGMANGTRRSVLHRLLTRQLAQVGYDLIHGPSRRVRLVSEIIGEHMASADQLLLIGHSAGGVVAYRSGLILAEKYGQEQVRVVAVGSPKFHLRDIPFNKCFTYISGRNPDRITRIGSWRRPGSRVYCGKPGLEIQLDFNPGNLGWQYHASYFLKSVWVDQNHVSHSNVEDLISKIHELHPEFKG